MLESIMLNGKSYLVDSKVAQKARDRLAQIDRFASDVRIVGPSTYRNATYKVTGSNHSTATQPVDNYQQWQADKKNRMHDDFSSFVPKAPNLDRMMKAFDKIA